MSSESSSNAPFCAGTFVAPEETKVPNGVNPIQLYSLGTPNGHKISIALEEMGLKYDAWTVDIRKGVQFSEWFKSVNPNSKIPALVDKDVIDKEGNPMKVFESGCILLYLAEKTGKFLPSGPKRWETLTWLFWQMAGLGPMFGQFGHFTKYAPEQVPYAINRYTTEAKRLCAVLEKQLEGKKYIVGDEYTIADMSIYPWIRCVDIFYGRWKDLGDYPNIEQWRKRMEERPAVQKGLLVNKM